MADVFTIDPMSPVGVTAPVLQGGYYPSVDRQIIDGRGLVIPWGAGSLQRQMLSSEGVAGPSVSKENYLLDVLSSFVPTGDVINYNFEGLIGPPGLVGPAGPRGVTTIVGPGGIPGGVPTYVLDDGATPATPTGLTATAGIQYVLLEWDANSETDMDHYEVWRHTSDASGSASKINESYQTMMVDGGRTAAQIYYYWLKAVDHLGNTSAFTSSVNATPFDVRTEDLEALAVEAAQIAANAVEEAKIAADAVTAAKIAVAGLDGVTGAVAADHITALMITASAIEEAKIAADAVTAAKIDVAGLDGVTGAVAADHITALMVTAGAIEEAKIAADAVTATKIAVSGLDGATGNVAANHIVAAMLQTDCVTAVKIQADAVTATKINVVGLDGATGRIIVADATDADVVTGGINTHATTLITAGKIVISGAVNLDDWSHGSDTTKIDGGDIYAASVTTDQIAALTIVAGNIAAGAIETAKIAADAVTAPEINVVGLDGATGRIVVADATDADAVTGGINTHATTLITAGKIVISGAVNLDDWSHGSDTTKIDGGDIYAASVTTDQIAALTIVAGNIAAGAIETAKIAADAVTAPEINVVGLDGATGRIVVADATDADVVTGGINSHATTLIGAGKIVISGAVNLDDWRDSNDLTYIDGGKIYTNSIVSGSILNIAAAKVLIDGAVYLSNWRHSSDVTKIDGGDIYTNSITATQINANTITASEIAAGTITFDELKQTGGSEAVNTGCIRANAVTADAASFTAADEAIGGSYETVAQVTVTLTNQPVKVGISALQSVSGAAVYPLILRGATEIHKPEDDGYWWGLASWFHQEVTDSTPGTGSITYYFQLKGGAGSPVASYRYITVTELRK